MNVSDLYVCELLKYAVHSTRGKIDESLVFSLIRAHQFSTRSVSTNMFHVPQLGLEVHRQSLKYRGTLLLNHRRENFLPPDYEIGESRELSKSLRNVQNRIKSACLADSFCVMACVKKVLSRLSISTLEGPLWCG